jgi:sugar lactone lactonase YvrE
MQMPCERVLQTSYIREVIPPKGAGQLNGLPVLAYAVRNKVGESPTWHPGQSALYWIDVRAFQVLKLNPSTSVVERWQLSEVLGALALCQSGELWLALKNRLVTLDTSSGEIHDIAIVEPDRPHNRLNDGKVSPSGRWFVFGSMDDRSVKEASGALYCSSGSGEIRRLIDGLHVCNGIAFSPDATTIYFSDSFTGQVFQADWDEDKGCVGAATLHCTLLESDGRPDGAAIDSAGQYWSAGVSAGCLNVLAPDGSAVEKIQLPCRAPTMPAFGNSEAGTLYVTSLVRPQWAAAGPHDGSLIAIRVAGLGSESRLLADRR